MQPRAATAYFLFPSIIFLKKIGLLKTTVDADIQETIVVTQDLVAAINKTVPEDQNPAKQNADSDLRPHVINNSWGDCLQSADHWYDGVINSTKTVRLLPGLIQYQNVTIMISLAGHRILM